MIKKYRVWDKKDLRWVSTNVVVDFSGVLFFSFGYEIKIIDSERYDVQYFTGFKDEDGNEIYEGDILKMLWGSESLGEVYYYEDYGYFGFKGKQKFDFTETQGDEYDIIGNIHENPELLGE